MNDRLIALFLAALLALNYPLLAVWNTSAHWHGIPLFVLALFGLWALLIGVLAWLLER